MKVHKLEICVIDFDLLEAEGVVQTVENTRYPNYCISPKVVSIKTVDIGEWEDDNPLNRNDTFADTFKKLFE